MNIALILAGDDRRNFCFPRPSQYTLVQDKMIITHCLEVFGAHPKIHAIQIVASEDWRQEVYSHMSDAVLRKFAGFSNPGANRQRSVFQGLNDLAEFAVKTDMVVIHDAIRPMVTAGQITACLKACVGYDGAVPVLPIEDTVYSGADGAIHAIVEHDKVFTGQTPEVFRLGQYYLANKRLMPNKIDKIVNSAEPAVMAGMRIAAAPGDEHNFKIRTMVELERYRAMQRERGSVGNRI